MPKITAPIVDTEVDPSDPVGSLGSYGRGVAAVVLLIATVVGGQAAWNMIANRTPDTFGEVNVL